MQRCLKKPNQVLLATRTCVHLSQSATQTRPIIKKRLVSYIWQKLSYGGTHVIWIFRNKVPVIKPMDSCKNPVKKGTGYCPISRLWTKGHVYMGRSCKMTRTCNQSGSRHLSLNSSHLCSFNILPDFSKIHSSICECPRCVLEKRFEESQQNW